VIEQAGFALAVADGSLDGQIVLVNGALNGGNIACTEARCDPFWFAGLEDIPVDWTGPPLSPDPSSLGGCLRYGCYPASTPVPGVYDWWDGPFLVRPGGGRLELLGYLAGVLNNPVSVQVALEDPRGYPNASSPFDILPVQGYLIACATAVDCPATGHMLTDIYPGRRGPIGGSGVVGVLDPTPVPDDDGVAEGPFLARFERPTQECPRLALCTHPAGGSNPTVIGQYESEAIIRVDLQP